MSWIPLVGVVLLATSLSAYPYKSPQTELLVLKQIRDLFENRCLKNADATAFTNLMDYFLSHHNPLGDLNVRSDLSNREIVNITCVQLRPKAEQHWRNLVERLGPCLNLDEKYLLTLMIEANNSSYESDCDNDGKNLIDRIDTLKSMRCNVRLYTLFAEIVPKCFPPLNIIQHLDDVNYVWKKADFCSDLESLRKCIENYMTGACSNHEKLIRAFNSEYRHLLILCTGDINTNEVE